MAEKKKEKKFKITVQEIVIIIAVALVAAGFIVYSIIRHNISAAEDAVTDENITTINEAFEGSSSFKEAVSSLGDENLLPDEDGYYYVRFDDEETTEKIAYEDMTFVSGYVYGENSCCITVYSGEAYGKIVGYSSSLSYDILAINVALSTGVFTPLSSDIELDFAKYYLEEKYSDCAFILNGEALCVKDGEITADEAAYNKAKLYVIDCLSAATVDGDDGKKEAVTLLSSFTSLEEAVIYDGGEYVEEDGCVFKSNYSALVYVFPFAEKVVCHDTVSAISDGALLNARSVTSLTIPCVGDSLYTLMGDYAANLKSVKFTSLVYLVEDLFYGCAKLESIAFISGFSRFESGFFDGATPKEIFFGSDTSYVYLDLWDGLTAYVPFNAGLQGNISSAGYTVSDIDGVPYKIFGGVQ